MMNLARVPVRQQTITERAVKVHGDQGRVDRRAAGPA
jgi:hypothetical protein